MKRHGPSLGNSIGLGCHIWAMPRSFLTQKSCHFWIWHLCFVVKFVNVRETVPVPAKNKEKLLKFA